MKVNNMRYVVELTIESPEQSGGTQPDTQKSRVETLEIDANNVPEALQKAKDKFPGAKITDHNIRFR
jgi:hypothetical protein